MMELKTIREVSLDYGVSRRMLSYYEKIGLIESTRKENYAYRVYDQEALQKLQQIVILRKLQIPIKEIKDILTNQNAVEVMEVFRLKISQLDEEITALSTVKSVLTRFVDEMKEKAHIYLKLDFLNDESMIGVVNALSFSKNHIKEKISLEELNKPNDVLNKFQDRDIRIIYLPPMTVAAAWVEGDECEGKASRIIRSFVQDTGLMDIKPDARCFGFDCSKEDTGVGEASRVYETWVSIPDEMEVPKPLCKRRFQGGLYAAHVLRSWDFQDWRLLTEWVHASDKYDSDWGSPRWISHETPQGEGFEETLNFYNLVKGESRTKGLQLDLLFPIKVRSQ